MQTTSHEPDSVSTDYSGTDSFSTGAPAGSAFQCLERRRFEHWPDGHQ